MIRQIKKLLFDRPLLRNVGVLFFGALSAQIIIFAVTPLLTRIYTPEQFGAFATFVSIVSIISVFSSLRYELAIPMPLTSKSAVNLVNLAVLSLLLTCAVLFTVYVLSSEYILGYAVSKIFWLYLSVGVLVTGGYKILNFWAVRSHLFSRLAVSKFLQAVITVIVQVAAVGIGEVGLILGYLLGLLIGIILLNDKALASSRSVVSFKGVVRCAIKYKDYPLYSSWSGFLNVIGIQSPIIFFSLFFSPIVGGLYAMAHRLLIAPASLINDALGKVFLSRAPALYRDGGLSGLVNRIQTFIVYVTLPVIWLLIFASDHLFLFLLGERWEGVGEISKFLLPWVGLLLITSPFMSIFEIVNKQRLGVLFQFFLVGSRLISIYLGYLYNDYYVAVMLYSLSGFLLLLLFNFWMLNLLGCSILKFINAFLISNFLGGLISMPIILSDVFGLGMQYLILSVFFLLIYLGGVMVKFSGRVYK